MSEHKCISRFVLLLPLGILTLLQDDFSMSIISLFDSRWAYGDWIGL